MTDNDLQSNLKNTITGRDNRFVALWAAGLILFYAIIGYFGIHLLQSYKAQTIQFRQSWVNTPVTGQALSTSDINLPAGAKPVEVNVGIYINRIGEFSVKDNKWAADFDVWFRWTGDEVHPGENFEIVDGQIEHREKTQSYLRDGQRYECYHVQARFLKYIDASRAPFDDEELAIAIEDGIDNAQKLRYVADTQTSGINPQAIRRFLKLTASTVSVKLYNYGAVRKVHSRLVYAMIVSPPGTAFYFKMFQALFASVAIAFIAMFLKPTHVGSRFSLGMGAFFCVIGNSISIGSTILVSNRLSLADMTCGIALGTIFLTLVQSAVSLYIFDTKRQEKLSRFLDKVSFIIFLLGYVIVSILLPLAAKS
jgi:hypothetical protein